MTDNDRERFATLILGVGEYYQEPVSALAIEIYWSALKSRSIEEIELALRKHVGDPAHGHFMPKASNILMQCGMNGANSLTAWGEVLDAMEDHGAYSTVLFEDGVINAVIADMGGWPNVCHRQVTDENEIWLQKDFCAKYESYQKTGRTSEAILLGIHAAANIEHGHLVLGAVEPKYIASRQMLEPKQIVGNERKRLN